jgi:hypothetical protein
MKKPDKKFLLQFLKSINTLMKAEDVTYSIMHKRHKKHDGTIFVDLFKIQDIVYLEFRGQDAQTTYESFGSPAIPGGKPVAWYRTEFNPNEKYIRGPIFIKGARLSGFIPDEINTVITSYISPVQKLRLLEIMFKDLKTIETKFKTQKGQQRRSLVSKTEKGARI